MISGEYKIFIPLEQEGRDYFSPKGKNAMALRHKWDNLVKLCKSLKKANVPYEVEYHFGAEVAYALIYAGKAVRQQELRLAA